MKSTRASRRTGRAAGRHRPVRPSCFGWHRFRRVALAEPSLPHAKIKRPVGAKSRTMMEYESSVLAIWLIHPIIQSRNDSCLDCFLNPFRFLALIPRSNPPLEFLLSPLAPLGGEGLGVRGSKRGKMPKLNYPGLHHALRKASRRAPQFHSSSAGSSPKPPVQNLKNPELNSAPPSPSRRSRGSNCRLGKSQVCFASALPAYSS